MEYYVLIPKLKICELCGSDPTGNVATILVSNLATHPEQQETLYEEILRHCGLRGKMSEYRLMEMRYLKACIQESTRLAPIATYTTRQAHKP